MKKSELISIIVPCFNEEEAIPLFYKEIDKISNKLKEVDFEILFINDGSKDNTNNILKKLSKKDDAPKMIKSNCIEDTKEEII